MIAEKILIEVVVQPKGIKKKYPNYEINYTSIKEFIESVVYEIEHKKNFKYGYDVRRIIKSDTKPKKGDMVAFVGKSGYMGKNTSIEKGNIEKIVAHKDDLGNVYRTAFHIRSLKTNRIVTRDVNEIMTAAELVY